MEARNRGLTRLLAVKQLLYNHVSNKIEKWKLLKTLIIENSTSSDFSLIL